MYKVGIRSVAKSFGSTPVLRAVDLEIAAGELFFLLGPSGCGKTTLLRILSGFERPDSGEIRFDDRVVNDVAPRKRSTSMVFQNYALWPHMTVFDNISYGLEGHRLGKSEIAKRVGEALALVHMDDYGKRFPNQLSGGQQQRIALARALVVSPQLLLLDEPLSNLDARLRAEMRIELLRVHRETGITTVYVTHDQEEALSMADRIAFMDDGRIVQVDTPRTMYRNPVNVKTGHFLGSANIIEGTVASIDGRNVEVYTPLGVVRGTASAHCGSTTGSTVYCFFRPEHMVPGQPLLRGTVVAAMYAGGQERLHLRCGNTEFQALVAAGEKAAAVGSEMSFGVSPENVVVLGE